MDPFNWEFPEYDIPKVSQEEFLAGRNIRYGTSNPELMDVPFWKMMIRLGWDAWGTNKVYGADPFEGGPTWCFSRYGMSTTVWNKKFVVYVGGGHEDGYDPDFLIYNDVVVRDFEGNVWMYGYPIDIFPPTYCHTATPIVRWPNSNFEWEVPDDYDDCMVIIGGRVYTEEDFSYTPVYKLNLYNLSIQEVSIAGQGPGRISSHQAAQLEPGRITVWGGEVMTALGKSPNQTRAVLDLWKLAWEEA